MQAASPLTFHYGNAPGQAGELYLPAMEHATGMAPPVVVLLHGGFWRMPYGREQLEAVARALAEQGYAAWNLGYRRLGAPGVGWREIAADVMSGIRRLATVSAPMDLKRVTLVGHSAGGHIALWAAGEAGQLETAGIGLRAAVGLAALSDLAEGFRLGLGKAAVAELLAAAPDDAPALYADASPIERLPVHCRQVLLHGETDSAVPIEISRRHVNAARAAGDDAQLHELAGIGHMEFLDTSSTAFARLQEVLADDI